jgi:chromosome segregation ATPase
MNAGVNADHHDRTTELEERLTEKNIMIKELGDKVNTLESDRRKATALKQEVESLAAELESSKAEAISKEESIYRMNSELSQLKSAQEEANIVASNLLGGAVEVNSLRSHVVSLAVALERSENKRAEALSRLLTERESNAESLRRLSESAKRYYSSVSYGNV